jgi:MFS family permease
VNASGDAPWSDARLRRYLAARFAAATAITMLRAAIAWHVFDLSRSALHLGMIGLVQFVPAFGLTLIGGAVADARDRRRVMMRTGLVPLGCALVLCAATALGHVELWLLYVVVFAAAAGNAFEGPAASALLPALVSRERFPRAVALAQTTRALAFATGPAVCGLVIAAGGIAAAYALAGMLSLVGLASIARVSVPAAVTDGRTIDWASIRQALGYVRRNPLVLGCMTLDMMAVVFGGAAALLPLYATDILHVGAHGYGALAASLDAGAILCSLGMTVLPPIRRAGPILLSAVAVYAVATVVFGLSRAFPLSIAAYMVVGMADQVSVVLRSTAIQLATPDELRGRVSAVNLIFIGASNQLGAAESGLVAAATSATFSVVSGGVASLLIVVAVACAFPELRRYRL